MSSLQFGLPKSKVNSLERILAGYTHFAFVALASAVSPIQATKLFRRTPVTPYSDKTPL
jgi:hypothetical protein